MLRYANILSDRFLNSIFSNFRSLFAIYIELLWIVGYSNIVEFEKFIDDMYGTIYTPFKFYIDTFL